MILSKLTICLLVLIAFTTNAMNPWGPQDLFLEVDKVDPNINNFTQTPYWFHHQLTDHFNVDKTDIDTWSQRFWVISDFFEKEKNSPVFVLICGEYSCPGARKDRLFPIELAKENGALVVILEHRFYGLSQPFGKDNLTVSKLHYLNVDQALSDLAYFINWIKQSGNFTSKNDTKFITIGGSYAGALSAWFREKYPYLTVGALASSAVINSIIDYDSFDERVNKILMKSGQECVTNVRNLNKYVEGQILHHSDALNVKKLFNAAKLTDEEFLFYWADIIGELIQYGRRTMLCNLLSSFKSVEAQFEAIRQYALNNTDPTDYSSYALSKDEYDPTKDGSRQWAWQICSELGLFNTASKNRSISMRSERLNISFYKNWCEDIFEKKIWPIKGLANLKRGGKNIEATNLIITNGGEDPWEDASIIESKCPGVTTYQIDCEDCAHCVDLRTPSSDDSWSLWWTRKRIRRMVSSWLSTGWW